MKNKTFKIFLATLAVLMVFSMISPAFASVTANEFAEPTDGKFILNPKTPIEKNSIPISTRKQLEAMADNPRGAYHLVNDIDLSGADWTPIGTRLNSFIGIFDGQGYVIHNLTIGTEENPVNISYAGLFGKTSGAAIKNVGLEGTYININSSGSAYAGGICGDNSSTIKNCYNTGDIFAFTDSDVFIVQAGGICGNNYGIIENCYNKADVFAYAGYSCAEAGGICGSLNNGIINNCFNTGNISAYGGYYYVYTGGICGIGFGIINNCYNMGDVFGYCYYEIGASYIGGIFGDIVQSTISNCYNMGNVFSYSDFLSTAGGIGSIVSDFTAINNCYNTGDISAFSFTNFIGGICAVNYGEIINCYWNIESNQTKNGKTVDIKKGVEYNFEIDETTPLTLAEMKNPLNFAGFDFYDIWTVDPNVNQGYPILQAFIPSTMYEITTISDKNGTVYGSGTYKENEVVILSAEPNNGYIFEGWYENDIKITYIAIYIFRAESDRTFEARFIKIGEGEFTITGNIKSYNPQNPVTIQLYQGEVLKYNETIKPIAESGQKTQRFTITNVEAGIYTMVITKQSHTSFIIKNIRVNGDVNLTENPRESISVITLLCGDIDNSGVINASDLAILTSSQNYMKSASDAVNKAADLNGDGIINASDLAILTSSLNYMKGKIEVEY